jgi:hypothetical protein
VKIVTGPFVGKPPTIVVVYSPQIAVAAPVESMTTWRPATRAPGAVSCAGAASQLPRAGRMLTCRPSV